MPDTELRIDADNVTFVLNLLDVLAGDTRFVELRNREPLHRPLSKVDSSTKDAREKAETAITEFYKKRQSQEDQLEKDFKNAKDSLQDELDKLKREGNVDPRVLQQKAIELSLKLQVQDAVKMLASSSCAATRSKRRTKRIET